MSLLLLLGSKGGSPPPETSSRIVINREFPPSKVCVLIRDKNDNLIGRHAEDESNIANVLQNLTKTGDMPGGHGELSYSLARDPKQSWPDIPLYAKLELQGVGGERLWSGTIWQKPEQDGERQAIEVKAIGDKQFLEDDEAVVGPGFFTSDQSKWGDPSAARRLEDKTVQINQNAQVSSVPAGGATPAAIVHAWSQMNNHEAKSLDVAESWWRGGGLEPGFVWAEFAPTKQVAAEAAWNNQILALAGDSFSSGTPQTLIDFNGAAGFSGWPVNTSAKALVIQDYYGSPIEADLNWEVQWRNLKVLGRQGLGVQGVWPNIGLLASQMIPFIASLAGLQTREELLEDDGFIISEAWYDAPATLMSKLVDITKYGLLDWFIFNDRVLQYRNPGTYGRKWRLSPGNVPKNSGPDAGRILDSLVVSWQDVDGTTKTIGPAGSGADYLDNHLLITDEQNPAVAGGRSRRKLLALNGVCTAEMALKVGVRFLEEVQNLAQSGEATITGYVQDQYGTWYPAAYVQPGDEVTPAGVTNYRRITSANYGHDGKSVSVTLDAPRDSFAALEARFAAKLLELGLG